MEKQRQHGLVSWFESSKVFESREQQDFLSHFCKKFFHRDVLGQTEVAGKTFTLSLVVIWCFTILVLSSAHRKPKHCGGGREMTCDY